MDFRHRSITCVGMLATVVIMTSTSCSRTITSQSGGKSQEAASVKLVSPPASPDSRQAGRPDGTSDHSSSPSSPAGATSPGPTPSLSHPQRREDMDLRATGGEERIMDDAIVTAPMDSVHGEGRRSDMRREPNGTGGVYGTGLGQSGGATEQSSALADVYFGFDSAVITDEGRQALLADAEWLRAHPTAPLLIEGHCDERGTNAYNLVLGEKRAKAVRNFLADLRVDQKRVTTVSYGKERPFCTSHEESCHQQNRRGHLVVRR